MIVICRMVLLVWFGQFVVNLVPSDLALWIAVFIKELVES